MFSYIIQLDDEAKHVQCVLREVTLFIVWYDLVKLLYKHSHVCANWYMLIYINLMDKLTFNTTCMLLIWLVINVLAKALGQLRFIDSFSNHYIPRTPRVPKWFMWAVIILLKSSYNLHSTEMSHVCFKSHLKQKTAPTENIDILVTVGV